jgi:hypothetical protein
LALLQAWLTQLKNRLAIDPQQFYFAYAVFEDAMK